MSNLPTGVKSTSKPNIIFLDIDGVLCNPSTCIAVGDTGGVYSYIDPVSAGLVRKLCEDYNCMIVISSSWRNFHDYEGMTAILSANCPRLGRYVVNPYHCKWASAFSWRTDSLSGANVHDYGRGREIKRWIDDHSSYFDNFVILDDDGDMEPLMDNFVKTDYYDGFMLSHFIKAKEILTRAAVDED